MSQPANGTDSSSANRDTHSHSVASSSITNDGLSSASHFSPSSPTRQTQRPPTVSRDNIDSVRQDQAVQCDNASPINPFTSVQQPPVTPVFQFSSDQRPVTGTSNPRLHLDTNVQIPVRRRLSSLADRLATIDPYHREQMSDKGSVSLSQINQNSPLHTSRSYDMSYAFSPVSASGLNSPALSAMIDITPLPSPMTELAPRRSSSSMGLSRSGSIRSIKNERIPSRNNSLNQSPKKRKPYGNLMAAAVEAQAHSTLQNERQVHGRNRSISEFVPETLHNTRPRVATFGPGDKNSEPSMQREEYLATQRGLTTQPDPAQALPSPPPSNTSVADDDVDDESPISEQAGVEYFNLSSGPQGRKRKWRSIRQLGQGTFSKVLLATSEKNLGDTPDEAQMDPSKLVAVKVCEHGPSGGADEERIKQSLAREIDILKSVSHPSVVHLKALEEVTGKTFLVLTYCNGGDLFELASEKRDLLTPSLVRRMFAELVSAVRYLHSNWIVHRDIKLENVLVNIPATQLAQITDPRAHSSPIVTLTDLGLSRRIAAPPESPLLTTRCGSEDYAAPELLLGQPYDGRSTDAWALGVLLYALMEGRLPFDSPPGRPERSRNTHRIARCDWIWCRFGDEDGEWDPSAAEKAQGADGAGWEGAREVVEALLKKVRMGRKGLDVVEGWEWVQGGITVPGDIKRREDDGSLLG